MPVNQVSVFRKYAGACLTRGGFYANVSRVFLLDYLYRRCFPIRNNSEKEHYVNDEIRTLPGFTPGKIVRVIGPAGEQIGLLNLVAAQNQAYEKGLDLVLIAAQAEPPVCKIIDYGKFRFERDKRDKEAKKKQQVMEIKEIQLTCQIDTNDLNTKINHSRRFLTGGNKVKVIVKFKGRQMTHLDVGQNLLSRFAQACADLGSMDKQPVLEGRFMTMFLTPLPKKATDSGNKSGKAADAKNAASHRADESAAAKE